jgi:hypothetical protein
MMRMTLTIIFVVAVSALAQADGIATKALIGGVNGITGKSSIGSGQGAAPPGGGAATPNNFALLLENNSNLLLEVGTTNNICLENSVSC